MLQSKSDYSRDVSTWRTLWTGSRWVHCSEEWEGQWQKTDEMFVNLVHWLGHATAVLYFCRCPRRIYSFGGFRPYFGFIIFLRRCIGPCCSNINPSVDMELRNKGYFPPVLPRGWSCASGMNEVVVSKLCISVDGKSCSKYHKKYEH